MPYGAGPGGAAVRAPQRALPGDGGMARRFAPGAASSWSSSRRPQGGSRSTGSLLVLGAAGVRRTLRRAQGVAEVDELALQLELEQWGEEEEEDEEEEEPLTGSVNDAYEETDWRHWAERVSKESAWAVLQREEVQKEEWKRVMLALRRGDVMSSSEEYVDVLELLGERGEWQDAELILQCMWFNGFMPDHSHYGLVMRALQRKQRWDKMTRLFEEMVEHDVTPDLTCYSLAIQAYARKHEADGAYQVLQALKADGHTPRRETYHGLLHVLAQEGVWVKALEVLEDMVEHDVVPNTQTFNYLVLAYGNGGLFRGVLETIDYMQKMRMELTLVTFLYGMRAAERAGEIEQGLELFRRMKVKGIKTNEKIDEALMKISLAGNDPDRALQFFDAAVQRRQNWRRRNPESPQRTELCIYRQALRACEMGAASGLPPGHGVVSYQDFALQLLLELQKADLPLDSNMYLHAVTACEYSSSWSRVIYLLQDMKAKGIKVEGERFRSAYWNGILAADEDEDVDGAYDLFSQMKETGLTVEPFMYTTMIHMLEKHGQLARAHSLDVEHNEKQMKKYSQELLVHRKRNEWPEALEVLERIRSDGLTPSLKVTNTALSALQRPGQWPLVLETMEAMRSEGFRPDACSHTIAISAMISAGDVARGLEQLEVMQKQGVHPTSLTYGRLIFALEASGEPERALYLWDEMRQKKIEPDRVAYEAAIRCCQRCEFWEPVLELYGEMLELEKGPSRASRGFAQLAAARLGLAEPVRGALQRELAPAAVS